jgi:hypothetical protein
MSSIPTLGQFSGGSLPPDDDEQGQLDSTPSSPTEMQKRVAEFDDEGPSRINDMIDGLKAQNDVPASVLQAGTVAQRARRVTTDDELPNPHSQTSDASEFPNPHPLPGPNEAFGGSDLSSIVPTSSAQLPDPRTASGQLPTLSGLNQSFGGFDLSSSNPSASTDGIKTAIDQRPPPAPPSAGVRTAYMATADEMKGNDELRDFMKKR